MKELEGMRKKLLASGKASEINGLVRSPEVERISRSVDTEALKKAAASGDSEALSGILKQVLSTPEGQSLARKISETFGGK